MGGFFFARASLHKLPLSGGICYTSAVFFQGTKLEQPARRLLEIWQEIEGVLQALRQSLRA